MLTQAAKFFLKRSGMLFIADIVGRFGRGKWGWKSKTDNMTETFMKGLTQGGFVGALQIKPEDKMFVFIQAYAPQPVETREAENARNEKMKSCIDAVLSAPTKKRASAASAAASSSSAQATAAAASSAPASSALEPSAEEGSASKKARTK